MVHKVTAFQACPFCVHCVDGVCLKAMSCYFSVLEEGKPREKLECEFVDPVLMTISYDVE